MPPRQPTDDPNPHPTPIHTVAPFCPLMSGVDGTTLKEAKYINLSLHYLEQVIIALQERSMGVSR